MTLSLLPAAGSFATVARLARLLRVVRLVSVLPELRLIVGTVKAEHAAEAMDKMSEPDVDEDLLRRVETIRSELGELETRLRARTDAAST